MKTSVQTNTVIKEEEIRPDDLFNEFMRLSAADAEGFFDRSEFVEIDCPACESAKVAEHFEKHSFRYNHCADCGSLYVSPRPNPDELLRYYAESKSQEFWADTILAKTGESRKASIMAPNLERIEGIIKDLRQNPQRVLDIGSATGAFLTAWGQKYPQAKLIGIEPGEYAAEQCRKQGITIFEGFAEEEAKKQDCEGDLVTCFEVVEHVQDPEEFAKAVCAATAPGGTAVVTCLGADGFDIQVLWENSRSVMPPYHLNFLSKKGMEELFSKAGFEEVEVFTPGRLDVEIVERSIERGAQPDLSRFEKLLLTRDKETLKAFQQFLAAHALSSHVWIICRKS